MAYVTGNAAALLLVRFQYLVSRMTLYFLLLLNLFVLSSWYWIIIKNTRLSELMTFVSGISLLSASWVILLHLMRRRMSYARPLFAVYTLMITALLAYSFQLYGVFFLSSHVVSAIQVAALFTVGVLGIFVALEIREQVRAHGFKQARLAMVRYVAHDIRAPQSAILTLLDRPGPEAMPSTIKTAIAEQVGRTVALTDAFLWLSKAESSVYRFEPVFLGDVVHEAIDLAWPLFEKKQMLVQRDGLDAEDCEIRADREMLVRCVFNLLENAAKYSRPDTTVRVVMQRRGKRVSLSVQDQGVGMSPEFVRQAFAEYRRSRNSFGESGFGLGLAFVATVVEQHGAVIDCHSQPGQGSTFVLQFDSAE